jgi:hypothetical protein
MIEMYAIAALALIATGVMVGFLIILAVGIRSEERRHTIDQPGPNRSALGLRTILDAHVHPIARQDLAFTVRKASKPVRA